MDVNSNVGGSIGETCLKNVSALVKFFIKHTNKKVETEANDA